MNVQNQYRDSSSNSQETIRTRLVVIGAGPAGVSAALAAARQGVDTVLVGARPVLGGNSSSEIRVWSRGAVGGGNLWAEEMGIWGQLKLENLYRNFDANPIFWDEVLLDAVLAEPRIDLYLNTQICDIEKSPDGCLAAVSGVQQSSERRLRFTADFFIDATGDGSIGAAAGVPYLVGENGEGPGHILGSSILYNTRCEEHPVRFVPPDYAYPMEQIEQILGHGGRIINEKMSGSDCWWFEYGGMLDTIGDSQQIALELRRLVMGVWNYIKNSGRFPAENYTLDWVGSLPGKRDSRHMSTAYRLTQEDILAQKKFHDGAFYGGWYMDSHPAGGFMDSGEDNCTQVPVHVYQIPLRCLYQSAVPNLLFAGRNIGMVGGAFFSGRVMNTCALSGQAAAALVSRCYAGNKFPHQLESDEIEVIRQQLLREDVMIPGVEADLSNDLVSSARLTASSTLCEKAGPVTGGISLEQGGFAVFPGRAGQEVAFRIRSEYPGTLKADLCLAKLPNVYSPNQPEEQRIWETTGGEQTLRLQLPDSAQEQFVLLRFLPTAGVQLLCCESGRVGYLCGTEQQPCRKEPMLEYTEEQGFYRPGQAANGYGRPWGAPNQWCAAEEDHRPWLQLEWETLVRPHQVRLLLDPDLGMELPSSRARHWEPDHRFAPRRQMPPHLARDFVLEGRGQDGAWRMLSTIKENRQRLVRLELPECPPVTALRLVFSRTWGGPPAVYQLRVEPSKG